MIPIEKLTTKAVPVIHAIVTPPGSESEKRIRKVPLGLLFKYSSVCCLVKKPWSALQKINNNQRGKENATDVKLHKVKYTYQNWIPINPLRP